MNFMRTEGSIGGTRGYAVRFTCMQSTYLRRVHFQAHLFLTEMDDQQVEQALNLHLRWMSSELPVIGRN
jgi:hypothetical protein